MNKAVYLEPEFKALWDRIKYKTTYAIDFDSQRLIEACIIELQDNLRVSAPKLVYTKAELDVSIAGVAVKENDRIGYVIDHHPEKLPDIITTLQNETNLTRTGPSSSKRTAPTRSILWWKPRAILKPRPCDPPKPPKSNAAKLISKPWDRMLALRRWIILTGLLWECRGY